MGFVNNYSPLRYPGGKAAIADFFEGQLRANGITTGGTYCEPFAGGGGVALTLLLTGKISQIVINDLDYCIAAFWQSLLDDTDNLIKMIKCTPITLDEWHIQRKYYDTAQESYLDNDAQRLKLGFATFFLNRCNRAGILPKAGPIGGKAQTGKYKIDARFNKDKLIDRIQTIASRKNRIIFTRFDALQFLDELPAITQTGQDTFIYLDPPYYCNGEKLYLNFYKHDDHVQLASKIHEFNFCPWVMTYDDCQEIRNIYGVFDDLLVSEFPIRYSMQKVRKASEVLIKKREKSSD